MTVETQRAGLEVRTVGLSARGHPEISATVSSADLSAGCEHFVRFVAAYVEGGARIRLGETLRYGYWLTRFEGDEAVLTAWEHDIECAALHSVNLAVRYWKEQHATCEGAGAPFSPPRPDQLVVVSPGVFEGDPLEGVRYPSPEHMTGWWLTTARYDGKTESLRPEHCYHLTARRPDLAPYLALPFGIRPRLVQPSRRERASVTLSRANRRPSAARTAPRSSSQILRRSSAHLLRPDWAMKSKRPFESLEGPLVADPGWVRL